MRSRAFSLFGALVAAVALVSVSGAATAKVQREASIDVSTRASVVRYLRAISVNPRGVVIQRGARNYAGSDCPGKGWSCTSTAHPVVQVASTGGRNSFTCSTAACAVVQVSVSASAGLAGLPTNTARCVKTGALTWQQISDIANGRAPARLNQRCSITQSSSDGSNLAVVFEGIPPGLIKAGSSTATIVQTATGNSNGNTACVTQNIDLSRSGKGKSFTANLNAHQTVNISQDATGSGANSARFGATLDGACDFGHPLEQNQTLRSVATSKGAITQNENAHGGGGANMTIDIEQNQGAGHNVASGPNHATFVQTNTLTAIANSTHGPVSQTQSSADGGLLGTINQDSTGISTANATQTETQCEDAAKSGLTQCHTSDLDAGEAPASLTQTQFGPVHKGVGTSTQTGNGNDTFTINQSSAQNDDTGAGQTNVVQADCITDGTCTVTQNINVNGEPSSNTQSGQVLNALVICTGSSCQGSNPPSCSLPANDDGSTAIAIPLGFTVGIGGTNYSHVWVNNNGNVTFGAPLSTFTPVPISAAGDVIVAPFWADVDTRGPGSAVTTCGPTTYQEAPAFFVDWNGVGYFGAHADKLNNFQLLLVSRPERAAGDFDIIFHYDQVQWETGDASGGSGGLGGLPARVGWSLGSGGSFELPGSGVPGSFLDGGPDALISNNRGSATPGTYVFPVHLGVGS